MSGTPGTAWLRARLRRLVAFPALTGLILFLFPLSIVYNLICRIRLALRAGACLDVPRVKAGAVSLTELMRRRRPVVIEGLPERLGLKGSLELSSLRALAPKLSDELMVAHYKPDAPYFLYTGDYGRELDHIRKMSFEDFLETMFDAGGPRDHAVYQLFGQRSLNGEVGALIDGVAEGLAGVVQRQPEKDVSGIWIGSEGVVTPLHFDAWPGLLFQMHGAKRVRMFSPMECPNLYLMSPFAVGERWSALPGRSRTADVAKFPRFAKTTRHEAQLGTGDVLFIPPFWAHEVEALESNISMPFRFKLKKLDFFHPRILRAMCEVFHRWYLSGSAASTDKKAGTAS